MAKDIFLGLFGAMVGILITGVIGAKLDPTHKTPELWACVLIFLGAMFACGMIWLGTAF